METYSIMDSLKLSARYGKPGANCRTLKASPTNHKANGKQDYFFSESQEDASSISDWSKRDSESNVSYCLRLYFTFLDPTASHCENCDFLLYQILMQVVNQELDNLQDDLLASHHIHELCYMKLDILVSNIKLVAPQRTLFEAMKGAINSGGFSNQRRLGSIQPQIQKEALKVRIIFFEKLIKEIVQGNLKNDAKLDGDRCEILLQTWISGISELLPLQKFTRTLLRSLLIYLAYDILNVRALTDEVRNVVDNTITTYEARSQVMLTSAMNASSHLRPLVLEFIAWLRENTDVLVQSSRNELIFRCLNPDLRYRLKNQVYQSAKHFLAVFDSLSPLLTNIELPNNCDVSSTAGISLSQTLKDICRERFVLNGKSLSPGETVEALKAELTRGLARMSFRYNIDSNDRYINECILRILHAASRTASGGDSYFIVQDLFGGEDVLVKPTRMQPRPIEISVHNLAVNVSMSSNYDIYHMSDISEAEDEAPNALMNLQTTLQETLKFSSTFEESRISNPCKHSVRLLTISANLPEYTPSAAFDSNTASPADDNSLPHVGGSSSSSRKSIFSLPNWRSSSWRTVSSSDDVDTVIDSSFLDDI